MSCSVQFSRSVMSNTLRPHVLQHAQASMFITNSNLCLLSQWGHPTISSSVIPFSTCFQSFPALGSFPMSWLFSSDGQSIGVSTLASVLPMNNQDWFPLRLIGCISLQSIVLSRVFFNTTVQNHQFFDAQPSLWSKSHIHTWILGKKKNTLTIWTFNSKVMSLLFNMWSRFFIAFLPRSKCLLISRLQSPSTVILEPKKIKSVTISIVSHLFAIK